MSYRNPPTVTRASRRAKRFYSWDGGVAGKRGNEEQKRKFYSWAGKRTAYGRRRTGYCSVVGRPHGHAREAQVLQLGGLAERAFRNPRPYALYTLGESLGTFATLPMFHPRVE